MADTTPKLPSDFVLPLPQHQPPSPTPAPHRVGDYTVLRELSRGGMGVVYLAHDSSLDRHVVLKLPLTHLLHAEDTLRFLQEARTAARLRHPAVVPVHHVGQHQGRPFLVMDFLPGGSLHDLLKQHGPLPPTRTRDLTRRLAHALLHLHQHGVLHRDLKPHNVLLDQHGHPHLTDFGLALLKDAHRLTQTGAVLGTPSCMAPEQARGERHALGPHTDVYGLGAILYACLTARTPFPGNAPLDVLTRVLEDPPTPPSQLNPDVDPDLEALCLRCLAKHPHQRPTLDAVLRDLEPQSVRRPRPRVLVPFALACFAALGTARVAKERRDRYRAAASDVELTWERALQRALGDHTVGRDEAALTGLRQAAQLAPTPQLQAHCLAEAVWILRRAGRAADLPALVAHARALDPEEVRVLLTHHELLLREERPSSPAEREERIEELRRVCRRLPGEPSGWWMRATYSLAAGLLDEAQDALDHAQRLGHDPILVLQARSRLLLKRHRERPDALNQQRLLHHALAILLDHPDEPRALLATLGPLEDVGRLDLLERAYTLLLQAKPQLLWRRHRARIRLISARYDAAIDDARQVLARHPDLPELQRIHGLALAHLGLPLLETVSLADRRHATQLLRAHAGAPHEPLASEAAATLIRLEGVDFQRTIETVLRDHPRTISALAWHAFGAVHEGLPLQALETLSSRPAIFRDQPDLLCLEALAHLDLDHPNRAEALLNRALRVNPDHPPVLRLQANLALHRQSPELALQHLARLRARVGDPTDGLSHLLEARAYSALGSPGPARAAALRALRHGVPPRHRDAAQRLADLPR